MVCPGDYLSSENDNAGFTVSKSTVYRVLIKKPGWIKPSVVKTFPAVGEYHNKTSRPNEQ